MLASMMGRVAAALAAVALLVLIDVRTKSWAAGKLQTHGHQTFAHVRLQYATNSHSVLDGFGPSAIIVYSAVMSLALLGVLVHRILRKQPSGFLLPAGFVALLAGTLGNLHDRLERGYVIDFISLPGVNWPQTFNVADVSIALGIVLCLLGLAAAALRHARTS